jgi:protein-disulfide isomerase-like protein with CxxC motif
VNENEKENKQHSNGARMGREPLIVDASQLQDVEFVRRYASLIGLDPAKVRTNWDATSEEEQEKLHKIERRMKDTLLDSTGVQTSKLESAGIDIAMEKKKWEVEFGNVLAERLERLVRRSMGEYAWLYERRLRF